MKLKGILDFSLGNFLCLRGFAPMGVLQDISAPPQDIQRVPRGERLKEVGDYLRKGELVFFPEIILCVRLHAGDDIPYPVADLWKCIRGGEPCRSRHFEDNLRISTTVSKSAAKGDIRNVQFFQTGTIAFDETKGKVFSRLDGNHRLAATNDEKVRDRPTPFCIVLCRNRNEFDHFSRALFHNINYKQVPLTMEHNLKLILEDTALFPDELLQKDPSFGWPYYHARKLNGKIDYDLLPNLLPFFKDEPRNFLLRQFEFLVGRGVLNDNENAIKRFKDALSKLNSLFDTHTLLKESKNRGLLGALVYFQLAKASLVPPFVLWTLSNHLHLIEESSTPDLIAIFEKVLESRKRTIFVSMPFGRDATENHFKTIQRVAEAINSDYPDLKPPLKVERVDFLQSGTSFPIRAKIDEFMANCGLLIGDLTYCNPNVYHEIGFMDGKGEAEGMENANVLLFLDESVPDEKDRFVGFNLRGTKYIPFKQSEEFAKVLRQNLEVFFKLSP